MQGKLKAKWQQIKRDTKFGQLYEKYIGTKRLKRYEEKRRLELQKHGYKLSQDICDLLSSYNTNVFLVFGNLLGIVRENSFLEWDDDLDFGVNINDSFTWEMLENELKKLNLKKIQEFSYNDKVIEQTYIRNRLRIDFFNHENIGHNTFVYSCFRFNNEKYEDENEFSTIKHELPLINKYKTVNIKGYSLNIPEVSDEYFRIEYGNSWKTPDSSWNEIEFRNKFPHNEKGIRVEY